MGGRRVRRPRRLRTTRIGRGLVRKGTTSEIVPLDSTVSGPSCTRGWKNAENTPKKGGNRGRNGEEPETVAVALVPYPQEGGCQLHAPDGSFGEGPKLSIAKKKNGRTDGQESSHCPDIGREKDGCSHISVSPETGGRRERRGGWHHRPDRSTDFKFAGSSGCSR